jgi:hypothetical protein
VAQACTTQAEVEVEHWVQPAGVGTEMGRRPTVAADAGADAASAGEVGRGAVVVHHPVLRRSTLRRSYHNLLLLGFLMGVDCIIHDDDIVDKLYKCSSCVESHALLQLGGITDHEAVLLLLVRVHLV